ncbi:MAG: universal stress protein [Desulforhabdus sp.]|jgi:nucleotide-binding universal stress UspA family protein|nr:universal stress protein [Desulforhabdus sp.]
MKLFRNILYVAEATADQASAVARAVSLAENNQADLTMIEVISPVADDYRADAIAYHMRVLESLVGSYRDRLKIQFEVLTGTVFLEVIRVVMRNSHDLVIKPVENPDFLKRLFGSDDMHLLRKCPCPVWLMKPPEKTTYSCILAAVDFDPLKTVAVEQALNAQILDLAGSLALSDFASLHLVHAWEAVAEGVMHSRGQTTDKGISAYLEKEHDLHKKGLYLLSEELRARIGADAYDYLAPQFHLPKGPPKRMIPALAAELQADLVVMGTVARTGISGFFIGNTAEAILDQLACSVLAVKPPGFTTPVRLIE